MRSSEGRSSEGRSSEGRSSEGRARGANPVRAEAAVAARPGGRRARQPAAAWVAAEIAALLERLRAGPVGRDAVAERLRRLVQTLEGADLGAELVAARDAGVPWKVLERRYGLSRSWLWRLWRAARDA